MATIKDVARVARVGVSTVSRVLNQSGYFDDDTARRVRDAVAKLGYRKNVHWARLKRQSAQTVCFLLGNREQLNSMQMRLLVAAEKAFEEEGFDLAFARFSYSANCPAAEMALPRLLAQNGTVDGVVLAGVHHRNLIEALERRGLPYAMLGSNFAGPAELLKYNTVSYDDRSATEEAARYLLRMGHKRIAFAGNARFLWFRRRQEGYEAAMKAYRLAPMPVDEDWRVTTVEYGQLAVERLLRQKEPPTAILAANDEVAAGAWRELVRRGVRIPGQMSLVGFGDRAEFSILEPALTTVTVFEEQLGERLARMLLERLRTGKPAESVVFPCRLIERGSSAPPVAGEGK